MINEMGKELRSMQQVIDIREIGRTIRKREKEYMNMQKDTDMWVSTKMDIEMDSGHTFRLMVQNTKESGKMDKNMGREYIILVMEVDMRENGNKIGLLISGYIILRLWNRRKNRQKNKQFNMISKELSLPCLCRIKRSKTFR